MTDARVCFITAPNAEVAKDLSRRLLEAKACACVNLVAGVTSLYWWEGQIQEDGEILMVVKTNQANVGRIIELIKANHPYQVAEVISLPIEAGNPPYLDWIRDSTSR